MKKRIMALLLSLVMALSLVPTTVWAAGVSTEVADDGISVYSIDGDYKVEFRMYYSGKFVTVADAYVPCGENTVTAHYEWSDSQNAWVIVFEQNGTTVPYTSSTYYQNYNSYYGRKNSSSYYVSAIWKVYATISDADMSNIRWSYTSPKTGNGTGTTVRANGSTGAIKASANINYVVQNTTDVVGSAAYKPGAYGKVTLNNNSDIIKNNVPSGYSLVANQSVSVTTTKDSVSPNPIVFYVTKNAPQPPTEPAAPTGDELKEAIGKIQVKDAPKEGITNHGTENFELIDQSYTMTDVMDSKVNVTIMADKYVDAYNALHPNHTNAGVSYVTLTLEKSGDKWSVADDKTPVTFVVECETSNIPGEPIPDEVNKALGNVTVKCLNPTVGKGKDCTDQVYWAVGGHSVGTPVKVTDTQYTVEIGAAAFLPAFNKHTGRQHDLYSAKKLIWVLNYDAENSKWVGTPKTTGVDDTILVTHAPTDYREVGKIGGTINATCTTSSHGPIAYGLTTAFVYYDTDVVSVVFDGNGTYTATIKTDKYVDAIAKACNDKYNKDDARAHKLTSDNATVQWKFQVAQNEGKYSWSAAPVTDKDGAITVSHKLFVTFQPENGEADFTQNVYGGEKAVKPTDPTRAGYTFLGWYLGETKYDFDTPVTEDITLTGKWEIVQYTITYDYRDKDIANKTHLQPDNPTTYTVLDTITLNPITAKGEFGKVFWEWRDENNNPITEIPADSTGDRTISAYWQYPVNYTVYVLDKDGNKVETTRLTQYFNEGASAEYSLMDLPTKDGYTFSGWYQSEKDMNNGGAVITGLTGDKKYELYGKFEITPHNVYAYLRTGDSTNGVIRLEKSTLDRLDLSAYNNNDFISIGKFVSKTLLARDEYYGFDKDDALVIADVVKELKDKIALGKVGEKINWSWLYTPADDDDRIDGYLANDKEGYQLSGTLTLYSVMFKTEDSENVKGMPKANYGTIYDYFIEDETITMPADPTREGYTFLGWKAQVVPTGDLMLLANTNADEESKLYKAGDEYTIPAGDVVFVAQWQVNMYTVSFDSNGGSKVDDQPVKYQDKANKPADPTKSGYTFAGWYTDKKCTKGNEFSFDTKITGDITLYAKWDVKRTGTNPDAKNPYIKDNTTKTDGKKVESGKTFDAGIALYVGLGILSMTGGAVVIRKRKDF